MNKNWLWIYLKINTKPCLSCACMVFKISENKNNFCGRVIGWNLFLVCVVWPLIYLHYSFLLFGHFFFTAVLSSSSHLEQCFSTAEPRPGTGPWHQLYWAARVLLEFVILVFQAFFMNKYFIVEIFWGE